MALQFAAPVGPKVPREERWRGGRLQAGLRRQEQPRGRQRDPAEGTRAWRAARACRGPFAVKMWPPAAKGAHGAEPDGQRAGPAAEAPRPGWALTLDGLAALPLTQRRHHLLFSDLPEDGAAAASVFPRQSAELENRMPDPCAWTRPPDQPAGPAEPLLGVLKAAEARARVRSLRLRYIRMRVGARARGTGHGARDTGTGHGARGMGTGLSPGQRGAGAPRGAAHPLWPAGGRDHASHPAAGLRAGCHPARAAPATPAEVDADPGPSGPARGAGQPREGREAHVRTHLAPALSLQRRRVETILEEARDGSIFPR